jgi:NitT/TauT family transport system ATP-binding protein
MLMRLIRAHRRAADFVEHVENREEVATLLAAPSRIGVAADVIRRTLDGHLKVSPDGTYRDDPRYLLVGREGAARPDPRQAAWLYAQMVRWGQAPLSAEMLKTAKAVCRPDLYDAAFDTADAPAPHMPADGIGAFAGPAFDPDDIEAHLAAWDIKREPAG